MNDLQTNVSAVETSPLRRNAFLSLAANSLTLVVSFLSVAFLPLAVSIETYGYWNLYLLITGFVYVLSLGLNDGVYLRQGGKDFQDLKWPVLSRLFGLLSVWTLIVALALFVILGYFTQVPTIIVVGLASSVPLMVLRSFLTYLLQSTGRIAQYAVAIALDRGTFAVLLIIMLLIRPSLATLVAIDLLAKMLSLAYACFVLRAVISGICKPANRTEVRRELRLSVGAGASLMIAGLASMATIGVVRFSIQGVWGIAIFASVSLALSAAHLVTSFVQAVALVLFPWLRRISKLEMKSIFGRIEIVLFLLSQAVLLAYYPLKLVFSLAFPQYADSLEFLFIFFPVVVYEARIALLVVPFCNALHRERVLLLINVAGMVLSGILVAIFAFYLENLLLTVLTMLIAQWARATAGEIFVRSTLGFPIVTATSIDTLVLVVFLATAFYVDSFYGLVIILVVGTCSIAAKWFLRNAKSKVHEVIS